jgi:hypothetical protein
MPFRSLRSLTGESFNNVAPQRSRPPSNQSVQLRTSKHKDSPSPSNKHAKATTHDQDDGEDEDMAGVKASPVDRIPLHSIRQESPDMTDMRGRLLVWQGISRRSTDGEQSKALRKRKELVIVQALTLTLASNKERNQ